MNDVQDPKKQVGYLQQCLSNDNKPLISDIVEITKAVRDALAKCEKCSLLLKTVEEHFKQDGRDDTNVEDLLSRIRALRVVAETVAPSPVKLFLREPLAADRG